MTREVDKDYAPGRMVLTLGDCQNLQAEGYNPSRHEIAVTIDAVDLAIEKARKKSRIL